jgi:hypothetical protein
MLNRLRNELVFVLLLVMLSSLFFSRAILSVSMIVFVVQSLLHGDIKSQLKNFITTPLLVGLALLFIIPLITGLWSEDKQQWADILRLKLPLLLMPLAFAGPWQLERRQWRWTAYCFLFLVLISSLWTILQYSRSAEAINKAYLASRTMLTPLDNDHIRYSLLVSAAVLVCFFLLSSTQRVAYKILLAAMAAWFAVFIHLLAARTGLVSLYIILAFLVGRFFIQKKNIFIKAAMLVFMAMLPLIAYRFVPSFHNRVNFFLYEKGFFEKTNYLQGGSDAVRVISIKGGWELMNDKPVTGKGFGDFKAGMESWYEKNYPGMKKEEQILPAAEWMVYGAGAGWPGLIFFWIVMFIPFFTRTGNKGWFNLINIVLISSLLFDIGLEIQFGVFIYAFMILWSWKWFNRENA